ncbi:DUF1059 domain-containing protein [Actinocrinis sp.]|uniref:DUF1059 domain-containing protein n=1 Tax=Actinocrinis sp. TaxID=1920516 RepID=UPI002BF8DD05|nr:hypothetical protein [Actinocrinis sp.]HXR69844.1 hypothetical protein [Actinocrinis sp.]
MTRKILDCRAVPNEVGCTLALTGEPAELVAAAAHHAVTVHGHTDTPELRELLSGALADEPSVSAPGSFVQLVEFDTDRIAEWDPIVERWATAIGARRTARWAVLGVDRDRPGRYVTVVEFPSYPEAMANSDHPATAAFVKELQAICTGEPSFRNLDVRTAVSY